jgi:hypothetical protein
VVVYLSTCYMSTSGLLLANRTSVMIVHSFLFHDDRRYFHLEPARYRPLRKQSIELGIMIHLVQDDIDDTRASSLLSISQLSLRAVTTDAL